MGEQVINSSPDCLHLPILVLRHRPNNNLHQIRSPQFLERRRHALERFLNRTAAHPSLRTDPDFRSVYQYQTRKRILPYEDLNHNC